MRTATVIAVLMTMVVVLMIVVLNTGTKVIVLYYEMIDEVETKSKNKILDLKIITK